MSQNALPGADLQVIGLAGAATTAASPLFSPVSPAPMHRGTPAGPGASQAAADGSVDASPPPPAATLAMDVPGFEVQRLPDLEAFLGRLQAMPAALHLPFLSAPWLRAWYATLGQRADCEPVFIAVRRLPRVARTSRPPAPRTDPTGAAADDAPVDVLLLPLVVQREGVWRVLRFADAGVVDYNAPQWHPDWAGGADPQRAASALAQALREGLAPMAHWWSIDKMLPCALPEDGGAPNPLALALDTEHSPDAGNQFQVSGDWLAWRQTLPKRVRKEIERSWRLFERSPEARAERITDPAQAQAMLRELEAQQARRLGERGAAFVLDQPAWRDFYRHLLAEGLASGDVVLTALRDGPAVVSVLLGVASASRYIGLRQSIGGTEWMACSPGRLLDEASARFLHAEGRQWFDFGIGDYPHKSRLQMTRLPLRAAAVPLRLTGQWPVTAWRLRRWAREQPWARRLVQRLRDARSGPA